MKVFFSPSYAGFVHQDFNNSTLYFESLICNTEGLVSLLELHGGFHSEAKSEFERIMDYSDAMKQAFNKNPSNLFAPSYKIDKFNTAKRCLKWRDSLMLAKWDCETDAGTKRLKALAEIEKNFHSFSSDEVLLKVTEAVKNGCNLPEKLEIITPFDYSLFHPAIKQLLDALVNRGISVQTFDYHCEGSSYLKKIADILINNKNDPISLDDSDGSFEIMSFKEKGEALRFLSLLDEEYDVWINRDNKAFDYYQSYLNKPASGAEDKGVTPVSALPLIGISIFEKPFNIHSLLNWLSTPINPINFETRHSLINTIIRSGGYFNDGCKEIITKAKEEIKEKIKLFLPDIDNPEAAFSEDNAVDVEQLQTFLKNLSKWINGCLQIKDFSFDKKEQLASALETTLRMQRILSEFENEKIEFSDLSLAFDTLSLESKTKVTVNQVGSRNVINSSSLFAGFSNKTIWCDFYNPDEEKLTYDFLLPKEKEIFGDRLWKEENEKKYNRYNKFLPFLFTKEKLTLVTVEKDGTKDVVKEPLLIRIAQNMGNEDFLVRRNFNEFCGAAVKSESIYNRKQDADGIIKFDAEKNKPVFRQNESFSALSELIDNPFDYMFKYILKIEQSGQAGLSPIFTTKGSVAHRIIEILFNPVHGGKPADIRQRINNDFEEVFNEAILEKGEILLLENNKTERVTFKRAVLKCVNKLCDFIEKNNLEVEACEDGYKNIIIKEFKEKNLKIDLDGSIDMLLKDKNGNPVIFDFKYSPKMEKYKEWLENSRAMQLSIYKAFVRQKKKLDPNVPIRSAYVLLPDVKVVTADDFDGNIIKVSGSTENLLVKMANSYNFRKTQLEEGKLEDGEGVDSNKLEYVLNTDKQGLIALNIEKHSRSEIKQTKEENKYSNYKFFKAGK